MATPYVQNECNILDELADRLDIGTQKFIFKTIDLRQIDFLKIISKYNPYKLSRSKSIYIGNDLAYARDINLDHFSPSKFF